MYNILLTSIGRRSYIVEYFQKALNGRGLVHVANSTSISPAFNVADRAVVTPLIYEAGYIDFLLDYCLKNNIKAIISMFDVDLLVLSKNKELFHNNGIEIVVSDEQVINICNDKFRTYEFLTLHGFDTPKTYISIDKVVEDISNGNLFYPLIMKPRWGIGSIGLYQVNDYDELMFYYSRITKDIMESYLKYESSKTPDQYVLIQEKIEGQEYGLDVINDLKGNYINTIVKRKYAMRSGETDCAITEDREDIRQIGEKISKALRHVANLDMDLFESKDNGKKYILECNARFGGGYPFSHIAGVNLPLAIINWLMGIENDQNIFQPQYGVMGHKDIRMTILNNN